MVDVEENMWIIVSSVEVSGIVPCPRIKYLVAMKSVIGRLDVSRFNIMKAFEQSEAMHCYVQAVILP